MSQRLKQGLMTIQGSTNVQPILWERSLLLNVIAFSSRDLASKWAFWVFFEVSENCISLSRLSPCPEINAVCATMELLVCIVKVSRRCWWVPCKSDKLASFVFGPQKSDQNRLPVFLKVGLSKSSLGSLKGCESASKRRTCSHTRVHFECLAMTYVAHISQKLSGPSMVVWTSSSSWIIPRPLISQQSCVYQVPEISVHYVTFLSNWDIPNCTCNSGYFCKIASQTHRLALLQ